MSQDNSIGKESSINLSSEQINIKGKEEGLNIIEINNIKIIIKGKYIKIAEVREEWDQDVADPQQIVNALKESGIRIDLFTFIQRLPESRPKYHFYMQWDSVAALPILNYDHWVRNQIPDQTRNKIKKAGKSGIVVKEITFGEDLIQGISSLYNDVQIKQGRKNKHYNMPYEMVKKLNGNYLDRCHFFGAFDKKELIAYIKIVYTDKYARVMGILGKVKHQDKSPMNLLIGSAVAKCAERKVPYFVYAKYDYGQVGSEKLKEFKKNNGFENILIPRYFVPINLFGKIILKVGLHKGIKNILPKWAVRILLEVRKFWYSKKLESSK